MKNTTDKTYAIGNWKPTINKIVENNYYFPELTPKDREAFVDALAEQLGPALQKQYDQILANQQIVEKYVEAAVEQVKKAVGASKDIAALVQEVKKLDPDVLLSAIKQDGEKTRGLMKSLMTNTRNEILVALQSQDKKIDQLLVITEIWLYTISGTQWNEEARQKMLDLLSEETKKDLLKDLLDKIEKQTDGKAIIGNDLAENENVQRACDDYVVSETAVAIIDSTINQTEKKSESQEEIDRLKKDLDEALKRRDEAEDELRRLREGLDESAGRIDKEDYGLDAWDFSIKKNKVKITAYRGWAENLTIPASISGYPVVRVAGGTFAKVNSSIREVIISEGIATIDSEAFSDCDSLETITIPASIRDLGSRAFCNCGSLLQINYNATKANDLSSEGIFADCGAIGYMEIIFGDSVEHIPANLCNGSHNLAKVTISSNVKTIGKDAFKNCESLTIIYCEAKSRPSDWPDDWNSGCPVVWDCLSNNVAENGYIYIFDGKTRYVIKDDSAIVARQSTCLSGDIEIPESISYNGKACKVIRIAKYAFSNCKEIESIIIPANVTSIGLYAFVGCTGLTDVYYQGDLSEWLGIEFDGSPMEYADNLYINGELLQGKLVIPEGTEKIGDYAFYNCSGLTSITIPGSVESIGDGAFFGCAGLTSITIPDSVTSIGYGAFNGCKGLTSITIPDSVTSIGEGAFMGCSSLESTEVEKGNSRYHSKGNCLIETASKTLIAGCSNSVIPSDGSVTSIGERAFYGCTGLTNITIPDSVTSIGEHAFYKCSALKSIVIPDSVTSIGEGAFYECSALKSIVIPYRVTRIGNLAFFGCTGLTSITIPYSVTSIDLYAFVGCIGLTDVYFQGDLSRWLGIEFGAYFSNPMQYADNLYINGELLQGKLVIPEGTEKIGDYAFYNCSGLTSITIPDSVTSIGDSAFGWCTGLTDVYYQGDLSGWLGIEFGGYTSNPMFYGSNLYIKGKLLKGDVVIPEGTEKIGSHAFQGCDALTSITIPDSVTSIGNWAFFGCTGLTSITIPDSVTSIGNRAFNECSGLTSITIPDSVTSIGSHAFDRCTGLTSITIPDNITIIEDFAFDHCSDLTSVTFPESLTSIDNCAFQSCTSLTDITFQGTMEQWNNISKDTTWNNSTPDYTVTCTDGVLNKSGQQIG